MSRFDEPQAPSIASLALATLAALVVAGVVLIVAVLPAEYGIDPLGIGEAIGLVVLSEPGVPAAGDVRPDGLTAESSLYKEDRISFELEPGGAVEYKYRLEPVQSVVYAWSATGPVRTEMHAEADGRPEGTAEFFEIVDSSDSGQGVYTAPFPGIHGWYWLNLSEEDPITVTLVSSGFYEYAMEFFGDNNRRRYQPAPVVVDSPAEPPDAGPIPPIPPIR